MDISSATGRVAPDSLKALAILSKIVTLTKLTKFVFRKLMKDNNSECTVRVRLKALMLG